MALFDFITQTSYTFEGEKEGETVALFLHRHWYTLFSRIIIICVAALFPLLVLVIFGSLIIENNLIPLFTFIWSAYFMFLWLALFYSITMYSLEYWIVTDERIVNNVQNGFFDREVAELSISTIQDVSFSLSGFMATTLNYGNVEVQTAARENHFLFEDVPNPQNVKDIIMEQVDKLEDSKNGEVHSHEPARVA